MGTTHCQHDLMLLSDEYKQLGKHIASGAGFVSNFVLWNESGYFDKTAARTETHSDQGHLKASYAKEYIKYLDSTVRN